MDKLVLVFDYFKEAFHTNKQNKALYKPQIVLIAARVLLIIFVGIGVYSWLGIDNLNALSLADPRDLLGLVLGIGSRLLAILLAYALLSVILESGLLNMYKKAVTLGHTELGDFKEGVSKYFFRLLAGELIILICYLLSLPFYIILGILTLTVGLTVIPLVAAVFLTMWKVSLVMNDTGIFTAVKDSFGFAKRNFIPLTVLQIIHWAFAKGVGGGGSSNFRFPENNSTGSSLTDGFNGLPGVEHALESFVRILKITIAVLIPVISIATIAASIVAMIFEVFFSLAIFVAYKNGFAIAEKQQEIPEELPPSIEPSEPEEQIVASPEPEEAIEDEVVENEDAASSEEVEQ